MVVNYEAKDVLAVSRMLISTLNDFGQIRIMDGASESIREEWLHSEDCKELGHALLELTRSASWAAAELLGYELAKKESA